MRGIFFALLVLFQLVLKGQSSTAILDLKIKSEAFNHFSALVYGLNNEKGDRDVYLGLFENESVKFIDDELSLNNDNYSRSIKIGEFQEKVANRLITEIKDDDWGGMPFFIGNPNFTEGDSIGNIDIVVKHVVENIATDTKFSDTQILVFNLKFRKLVFYDENYNVKSKFDFRIDNVELHNSYRRPHFLQLTHDFTLISFGKIIPTDISVIPDSIYINNIVPIKNDLINLKNVNLLTAGELNINSFFRGMMFSKLYVANFDKLMGHEEFRYNRKIGEMGLKYFNNLISTKQYMINDPINNDNALGWFSNQSYALNLQFPLIKRFLKNTNSKFKLSPSNLSYLVIDIGYTNSTANIKIQNHRESSKRVDLYNNSYNRIADYILYKEERLEDRVFLNLGYQKRFSLSDRHYLFTSGLMNLSRVTDNHFSYTCDVRYSGIYNQFYQIAISENGIMDYGEFFFQEVKKPNVDRSTQFGSVVDFGVGFDFKKINFQVGLLGFFELKTKQRLIQNESLGVDYGVFHHQMMNSRLDPKRYIGSQFKINIYL